MRPILFSILAILLAASARAQPGTEDDLATRWLARHAVRLAPTPPEGDRFADLRSLAPLLRHRRVVILGEPTHGQGDVFALKARLVEYLHEELGFDVLAWEAGMYDVDLAWRRVQAGEPAPDALRAALPGFWGESEQVAGLLRYVGERASRPRPLEVVGLDAHVGVGRGGEEVQRRLLEELAELHRLLPSGSGPGPSIEALEVLWDDTRPDGGSKGLAGDPVAVTEAVRVLAGLRAGLERPSARSALGEARALWWRQCLDTLAHKARRSVAADPQPGGPLAPVFNPRDERLGENLLWLARERYPERRIVVWAATMHGARRLEEIAGPRDREGVDIDYVGVVPMGHLAWLGLGDALYVAGFTTYEGAEGLPWAPPRPVPAAAAGAFEDRVREAGLERAWIDLSALPESSPLSGPFVARPLGNLEMRAAWSRVLDALVFVRRVEPSRRRTD